MRNIKLTIEYEGTNYKGWQRQKNTPRTLQETIERALRQVLQEKIKLIASGRTDVGVHALAQVANFKSRANIPLLNLKQALNSLLPDDIVVIKAEEAGSEFHARFDVRSKIYRYIILNQKHPSGLFRNFVYFLPYKLDLRAMQKAAECLVGKHNFRSFQASDEKLGESLRTIKNIKIFRIGSFNPHLSAFPAKIPAKKGARFIYIEIESDGFLHKMVRNIVGTLIEIGRKKYPPVFIQKILALRNRQFAGPTVPGHGLFLLRVKY